MESRRKTRGRPKRVEEIPPAQPTQQPSGPTKRAAATTVPVLVTRSSPSRRASPGRRVSPVRRSSRPRSTVFGASASTAVVTPPSPVKEAQEPTKPTSKSSRNNLPTTLTTNTSTRAPGKLQSTASVHSSYSSVTQKTVEIRSSSSTLDAEITKLTDYIRRSVSKSIAGVVGGRDGTHTPTTERTDAESRYTRSVSRSVYDDDSKAEFSDNEKNVRAAIIEEEDEDEDHYKSFNATLQSQTALLCRKIEVPREFGGWLGATALLLLAPAFVYYLQWSCGKSACRFKPLNLTAVLNTKYITEKVFQGPAVGAFLSFNLSVFVLSALLFGRRVRLPTERASFEYKFNALPIAVLLCIGAAVAEYLKYPLADFVLRHYLRFCIYGFVNAFIVALWCYIRTDWLTVGSQQPTLLNPYGKSGNFIVDYALGRQINPRWLGFIEFKQVFYRISLLSTLLLAICFIYKIVQVPRLPVDQEGVLSIASYYMSNIKYDSATLLTASLLLCYVLDAIVFEHHLASSFELQGEGFGCLLLLRYAATPYLLSAVAKYFFDRRVPLSCKYAAYVPIVVLLAGLILKRLSSALKYKYRINPTNSIFLNAETIHTFQGRRLLLGALWGRMRQPNYAGDILALCGLGLPIFLRFAWPPLVGLVLLICLLLHRTVRVNVRNMSRYHSSWVRYCSQVRYYVLPKVY